MTPPNTRGAKRADAEKIKWASWKQLNRLARELCEAAGLEYAPDGQTVSAMIDRLAEHRAASTSDAPAF